MVLEAVAAVGLASAVVHLVEFTTKVVSKGQDYHKSVDGTIKEHFELNEYAASFARLSQCLTNARRTQASSQNSFSQDERSLILAARKCQATCDEIRTAIASVQKSRHKKIFASLHLALRAVWSEEKIESCLRKL